MLKNNIYVLFLFMGLLVFSCKKDRLKGESEVLVGKWIWVKTVKQLSQQQFIYSDPLLNGNNYKIEFLKCGKFYYYENGNRVLEKRMKFNGDFGCIDPFCVYYFTFEKTQEIEIRIYSSSNDTLYITDYPFNEFIDGNGNPANYWNVYVRE